MSRTAKRLSIPQPMRRVVARKLFSNVRKTKGCWIWRGGTVVNGYGMLALPGGRMVSAHRVSWVLSHGTLPRGVLVLHKCDNPLCIRPKHLFRGSNKDNSEDMVAKGRVAMGERCALSKLTDAKVRRIKKALRAGESQASIARRVGVVRGTISYIARNVTWRHVTI